MSSNLIHKITKDGKTIYPATTTDAVVHPSLRAEITKIFTEYNISALFPTNGIDSGDKYNLGLAISILNNNLKVEQKNPGTKMIFKNSENQIEAWKFNGTDSSTFANPSSWNLDGLADEKTLPQVKTIKFVRGLDEDNNPVIIDQTDLLSSLSNINKGYFPTEEELKAKYPEANLGDIAYVGTNYPYQIWRWNGEAWVNTGETGGQEDVDLNNYYNKSEIDEKFKENGSIIPILPVAPGESTTTWSSEEGEVYTFKIGQFARVADPAIKEEYRFYQLYDITPGEGKAKWKETGIEYDVVTLDTIPGESTLTWSNGIEVINFKIGQQVRVDSGNATSDKVFYQLYDIKNGLAVWEKINLDYSPITLATKPTESTLTWKLGNIVNEFEIGQQVRVEKTPGTEDYIFYQLFDIKGGLAVWKETGSGGSGGSGVEILDREPDPENGPDVFIDTSVPEEDIEIYTKAETEELIKSPTFSQLPEPTQLEWTDSNNIKHYFWIGQTIRVGTSVNDYTFYTALNVTDSEVTWQESGSGGSGTDEKVIITINSNISGADQDLIGHSIINVLKAEDDSPIMEEITWNGSNIIIKIPAMIKYKITITDIEGYKTPDPVTFDSLISGERQVTMTYQTCQLTVNLDSNQSDKTDIYEAQAIINYGDTNKTINSGNAIKIPFNESITISASEVSGYKTPSQTLTADTNYKTITLTYQTEVVNVTLSADDESDVSSQTITITNTNGGSQIVQGTGRLEGVKVPFGVKYKVSVNEKDKYDKPADQIFTANQVSRNVNLEYIYRPFIASYITLNQTIKDAETMLGGDINGEAIQLIRQNSHRYLGKYTGNGEMTICQLKDDDSTKFAEDGSSAVLTGTQGDVFMKLPQFWYKAEETGTNKWRIGFAYQNKPDNTWKEWDGNSLIGVYEAYNSGSKAYSRSGVGSTGDVSQSSWKTYSRNRGNGYCIVQMKHHNIMAFLYYAMYGNMNCQEIIGKGTSDYEKQCGQTNSLGMTDTQASTNGNSQSINFWGLENWWGDKYEFMDNIVVDNYVWTISGETGGTRTFTAPSSDGWISKVHVGEYLDMVPKEASGASETTGFCDFYWQNSGGPYVVLRSDAYSDTYGGVACVGADNSSSGTGSSYGSRLAFNGTIVEAESVSAFKAISVTN